MDDVVVSKIFSIPVNVADDSKLYHFSQDTEIMYGPGEEFDVMANGQKDQTVRITGFTLDKSWYRVMLDSGEMGFVPDKILRRGAKTPPLDGSKIVPNI